MSSWEMLGRLKTARARDSSPRCSKYASNVSLSCTWRLRNHMHCQWGFHQAHASWHTLYFEQNRAICNPHNYCKVHCTNSFSWNLDTSAIYH